MSDDITLLPSGLDIPEKPSAAEQDAEYRSLAADAAWKEARVASENQRRMLRQTAYGFAVGVVGFMSVYLMAMVAVVRLAEKETFSGQAQIAIFGAPIAAIAVITIFVLRGVFNGFAEKGFGQEVVPVIEAGRTAIGS